VQVIHQRATARLANVERLGDGGRNEVGIADGCQRHQEDAVAKRVTHVGGGLEGQSGLAGPARTGEREQAAIRPQQVIAYRRQFGFASDERRCGGWQVREPGERLRGKVQADRLGRQRHRLIARRIASETDESGAILGRDSERAGQQFGQCLRRPQLVGLKLPQRGDRAAHKRRKCRAGQVKRPTLPAQPGAECQVDVDQPASYASLRQAL